MSAQSVLNEDWSEYDDRKKKHTDSFFFSCEEPWEVDYLVRKISKQHPLTAVTTIRQAIAACCVEVKAPRPRKTFVDCVMRRLGL